LLQRPVKPTDSTLNSEKPAITTNWSERKFSANLMGSSGDRRIDFTLNRTDDKISGSFAIHNTGHGDIRGEYNPDDKTSPLRLECAFTKVLENPDPNKKIDPALLKLVGQTRVLDGWFLYTESGAKPLLPTSGEGGLGFYTFGSSFLLLWQCDLRFSSSRFLERLNSFFNAPQSVISRVGTLAH
jgi:hypothetical protein